MPRRGKDRQLHSVVSTGIALDDAPATHGDEVLLKEELVRAYRATAYLTFNVLVVFVIGNLAAAGLLFVANQLLSRPSLDSRVKEYRRRFADLEAYKRISQAEALQYLNEQDQMASLGFRYTPWREFANVPFQGRFLNTDDQGFRKGRSPQRREGPTVEVFVFGGSTTFGYGVPDSFTIPSYLQEKLEAQIRDRPIRVTNLGQGYYYSSQELALLISLSKERRLPAMAVFIDGANDTTQLALGRDEPWFSDEVKRLWDIEQGKTTFPWAGVLSRFALYRAGERARLLLMRLTGTGRTERSGPVALPLTDEERVGYVISRYQANKRTIGSLCGAYGIRCLFVWQPVPFYKYDRRLHRAFPYEGQIPAIWPGVYARMSRLGDPDFLYLGDMLEDAAEKVFVDDVHYNEVLSERIAGSICERLVHPESPSQPPKAAP